MNTQPRKQEPKTSYVLKDYSIQEVPDDEVEYEMVSPNRLVGTHANAVPLYNNAQSPRLFYAARFLNQENPSYWPYGLSTTSWNGGLWLIRDAGTQKAAGFVGWQEFNEGGKRVGYYGIGMLPEFRKKGYAAEAVAKIIQEKRASVDAVRAFIMPHNGPSHALARTLGVEVVHEG